MSDQPRFSDAGVLRSERISRVEVVSSRGREFSIYVTPGASLHLQDDGRTLKVFVDEEVDYRDLIKGDWGLTND